VTASHAGVEAGRRAQEQDEEEELRGTIRALQQQVGLCEGNDKNMTQHQLIELSRGYVPPGSLPPYIYIYIYIYYI
jgi:hypothetical protein